MSVDSPAVSNIYPLTLNQQAFWIERQRAGDADPGLIQVRFTLRGVIDDQQLRGAWQQTIQAHEALRMSVNAGASGEPFLVVRPQCSGTIDRVDLTGQSDASFDAALNRWLRADKQQSLNIAKAPAMRLSRLVRSDSESVMVWTCHHMLLDGWSAAVVIKTLVDYSNNDPVSINVGYGDFTRWLATANNAEALAFWQASLAGVFSPTTVAKPVHSETPVSVATVTAPLLSPEQVKQLESCSRRLKVSAATVLQAAWGLVLGARENGSDVMVGIASACRHPQISRVQLLAGQLSTVVPLRVRLQPDEPVGDWLIALHAHAARCRDNDFISLPEILSQAEPGCRSGLFDTLLTIENLPDFDAATDGDRVAVTDFSSDVASRLPLTITVVPGEQWQTQAQYLPTAINAENVHELMSGLATICAALVSISDDQATVASVQSAWTPATADHTNKVAYAGDERQATLDALVAPETNTELSVLSIFENVLQHYPLSVQTDFFEAGGSSIGVLGVISAIETKHGIRVPAARFIESRTPRALAAIVESSDDPGSSSGPIPSLIKIKDGQSTDAVFCVHAGGGHALFYRDFANRLGGEWPVYALQPKGVDGKQAPLTTIEAMAEHYVNEIVAAQPAGPYHLLCYCYGGGLLLEMADRIVQRGLTLGELIVADAPSPVPQNHPMARFGWRAYLLYEYVKQGRYEYLPRSIKAQAERVRYRLRQPTQPTTDLPKHLTTVQAACEQAFKQYRARQTKHPVTLVLGDDTDIETSNAVFIKNWDVIAPHRRIVHVPGDHLQIFNEPYVRETGDAVAKLLRGHSHA